MPRLGPIGYDSLAEFSRGRVSGIFGASFASLDALPRKTGLPMPPLMLLDRVLRLDFERGEKGYAGAIEFETDLREGKFYLGEDGYPSLGMLGEMVQGCTLILTGLGFDFRFQGDRLFRLLNHEVKFTGALPRCGETLKFRLQLNSVMEVGGLLIFAFSGQGWVGGELRLETQSQAGYFTERELAAAKGVQWDPEKWQGHRLLPPIPPPVIASTKRRFSREDLVALSEGRVAQCLGEAYREADSHHRTPTLSKGNLLLLDAITDIDLQGGPWRRGYLAAESRVSAGDWYFSAHFRNDPCMPGSLVFEACVQAMRFDLLYRGYSLSRPGQHFEPVPGSSCRVQCRGQVRPNSRELKIEIFVKQVGVLPFPYLQADAQVHCDGLKLFRMEDLALRLAPEFP